MNSCGQLGLGSTVNESTPRPVSLPNRFICAVACGHKSTLALTESGEVYAWGSNEHGQVGSAQEANHHSPYLVEPLAQRVVITQIACGFAHSLALSDEGRLYVWGSNQCGQLACNTAKKKILDPVETVKDVGGVSEIAAANACNISVVVNKKGKVFMFGNIRGQCVSTPLETRFFRVDDVFATFASPPISPRMLNLQTVGVKSRRPLLDALRAAFDDPSTSDVKMVVEGKTIHAHRALLKLRCEYFRSRLGKQWSENSGSEIAITDFSYSVFRSFVRWLYTDELLVESSDALGLLELANCYCEKELKRRCAELVQRTTTVENAALLYATALRHDVPSLEEHAFQFCMMHMTSVTLSDAFSQLDADTLRTLVTKAAKRGIFRR